MYKEHELSMISKRTCLFFGGLPEVRVYHTDTLRPFYVVILMTWITVLITNNIVRAGCKYMLNHMSVQACISYYLCSHARVGREKMEYHLVVTSDYNKNSRRQIVFLSCVVEIRRYFVNQVDI